MFSGNRPPGPVRSCCLVPGFLPVLIRVRILHRRISQRVHHYRIISYVIRAVFVRFYSSILMGFNYQECTSAGMPDILYILVIFFFFFGNLVVFPCLPLGVFFFLKGRALIALFLPPNCRRYFRLPYNIIRNYAYYYENRKSARTGSGLLMLFYDISEGVIRYIISNVLA